jgi:hypothetical protein
MQKGNNFMEVIVFSYQEIEDVHINVRLVVSNSLLLENKRSR